MKKVKKRLIGKGAYGGVFIIFFAVCVLSGIFSFQYYNRLQHTIQSESSSYLQEISSRIGSNINRIIDDNYASLHTMAEVLKNAGVTTFSEVKPAAEARQEYWKYEHILLIDQNGRAYNSSGQEVPLNNDTYFQNAVVNKQAGISTTQLIEGREYIMFSVPLEITLEGKQMAALAASYAPGAFDQTLSMSAFNDKAYSCIVSTEGTYVVRSSAQTSIKTGYNVFATIGKAEMDPGSSIEKIKNEIAQNKGGQIGFTQNGVRYYMVYTPINPETWYLLTFVPSAVINEKSDSILRLTLFLCGLIAMVFAGLIAFLLLTSYWNKKRLEQMAYVDEVTGGHTIQRFYELARESLISGDRVQYALVYSNFTKFKVLNEQFGRRTCDYMLKAFHDAIEPMLEGGEYIGRLSADNFCLLLRYGDENGLVSRFRQWQNAADEFIAVNKPIWGLPVTEFGVFIIDNDLIPFPQMIDRAKLALRESPRIINNKLRCAIYDDEVRRQLLREKQLEDMMEDALNRGEFQVYLQPKYRLPNKRIGGAEALARWVSESEGMIFPDEFIPLFEKNGFIIQLDLWMFAEVCRRIRGWMDAGLEPVKISVNCSRVHLRDYEFIKSYSSLAARYQVPPRLLEIELTESVVMEDSERLTRIIESIHEAGFGCSMDDFGSGYSSLNLIQSIPVDTLKLDKIFFRENSCPSVRTESVISSIISMAKALSMETVAEGVEYQEQVRMLEKVGCDYIQGYVFAKPMTVSAFEELAFEKNKEESK